MPAKGKKSKPSTKRPTKKPSIKEISNINDHAEDSLISSTLSPLPTSSPTYSVVWEAIFNDKNIWEGFCFGFQTINACFIKRIDLKANEKGYRVIKHRVKTVISCNGNQKDWISCLEDIADKEDWLNVVDVAKN